ncbi:caldesmon-like [Mizuhopecten yessoensis]|uniref:caldesmon-like n=1 Tax=Mizuhopecten yessoensis TaxID=6573 RepID=UPI000B45F55D|nr:caldesmon-like [Mizuhopecten yessoensis]
MMNNLGPSITEHLDFPTSNAHTNAQDWDRSSGTHSQARRNGENSVHDPHQGHAHGPAHQEIDHSNHEHVGGAMAISNFVSVEANPPSGQTPTREEALALRQQQLWDLRNGVASTASQTGQQPTDTHHEHAHTGDLTSANQQPRGHTDHSHIGSPTDTSQFVTVGSQHQSDPMPNPSDPSNPSLTRAEKRERHRQRRLNRLNGASEPVNVGSGQEDQHLTRQERNRQRRLKRRWEKQERRRLQRLGQGSADPTDAHRIGAVNTPDQHDRNNQRLNRRGRKRWNRNNRDPTANTVGPVDQSVAVSEGTHLADTAASSFILQQEQTRLSASALEWLEREKARLLAVERAKLAEKQAKELATKIAAEKAAEVQRAREKESLRQKQEQERLAAEMRAKILAAEQAAEKARRLQKQIAEEKERQRQEQERLRAQRLAEDRARTEAKQRARELAMRQEAERQRQEQERLRAQRLAEDRARKEAEQRAREKAIERARLAELQRMTTTVAPVPVVHVRRSRRRRRRLFRGIKRLFGKK